MLLPLLTLNGWSVTNSHHDVTLTGLPSHPVLQVINQTAIRSTEELHVSELLLHREGNTPSSLSLPVFPKELVSVHHSTSVMQCRLSHQISLILVKS